MLNLLKIKVSGFKNLPNDFLIDFTTKARVSEEEGNVSEIIEVAENLYTFNIMAFTGCNSSGKSTVLSLISRVLTLMKTGRWRYRKEDFNSDNISLRIEFFLNNVVYAYESQILPNRDNTDFEIASPYCKIINETIDYALYKPNAGKRYLKALKFDRDNNASGLEDTSVLVFVCRDYLNGYFISPFSMNGVMVSNSFFDSLNIYSEQLTCEIIRLLDESIEYIKYVGQDNVVMKRFGQEEKAYTKSGLLNVLSNGTVKGIELYIRIVTLLKTGGILVVDEIENCFHKNLVNNILFLITDKTLNKKEATIIFSTHYSEILDVFQRRDNIFILHKNNNKIDLSNLYEDYDIRTEISKSKQFNNNTFGTLLNYDRLMTVKRLIKDEVTRHD